MQEIKSSKQLNKVKGNIGESEAVAYLEAKGYKILQQNYSNKIGEIDIIAQDKERIVFVEVKKRATLRFGYPREAVNEHKQNKVRMVAQSYLKFKGKTNAHVRFDVIEILDGNITHIENAF